MATMHRDALACEAKIKKLENEKAKQETKVADHHDGHDDHVALPSPRP